MSPEALEKRTAGLRCPFDSKSSTTQAQTDAISSATGIPALGSALICIFAILFVITATFLYVMIRRERQGNPMFTSLLNAEVDPGVEFTARKEVNVVV